MSNAKKAKHMWNSQASALFGLMELVGLPGLHYLSGTVFSMSSNTIHGQLSSKGGSGFLRLRGKQWNLDLWVCYLDCHEEKARTDSIRRIAEQFSRQSDALSVMFGDFNFTSDLHDRFQKHSGKWSGDTNAENASALVNQICNPFGVSEWGQPEHTCEIGIVRSRIDRVYANQHVVDQLDRQLECGALSFPYGLSAHRPVSFARRVPVPKTGGVAPLKVWAVVETQ